MNFSRITSLIVRLGSTGSQNYAKEPQTILILSCRLSCALKNLELPSTLVYALSPTPCIGTQRSWTLGNSPFPFNHLISSALDDFLYGCSKRSWTLVLFFSLTANSNVLSLTPSATLLPVQRLNRMRFLRLSCAFKEFPNPWQEQILSSCLNARKNKS